MNFFRLQFRHIAKTSAGILVMLLLAWVSTPLLNAQQSGTEIVFSAQLQVTDQLWPVLFQSWRADLAAGDDDSSSGVLLDQNPTLILRRNFVPETSFDSILRVKVLGRCDLISRTHQAFPDRPLGWVPMISGQNQPFISIDCARLSELLGPKAFGLDKKECRRAMAQAIAHVLIHEWIHIAMQRPSHDSQGIMKASISVKTLIVDPSDRRLTAGTHSRRMRSFKLAWAVSPFVSDDGIEHRQ